jgi:hypothetical protein
LLNSHVLILKRNLYKNLIICKILIKILDFDEFFSSAKLDATKIQYETFKFIDESILLVLDNNINI